MNVDAFDRNVWLAWVLVGVPAGVRALPIAAETLFLVGVVPSGGGANMSGWTIGWAIQLGGALAGGTFGAIQRLVLRRVLPHLRGWVWVSTAGFGAEFAVVASPNRPRESARAAGLARAWAPLSAAAVAFSLLHTPIDWHIGLFGPSGPALPAVPAALAWMMAITYGWWAWCLVRAAAGSRSHLVGVVALSLG
jgi:hypothetical protein